MREFLETAGLTGKEFTWCMVAAVASLPIGYGLIMLAWLIRP
jgi:hypothetical protein